jgi:hypothetical protein
MRPAHIVWWRYGKEHDPGGSAFQVNPPQVVAAHIDQKLARLRALPAEAQTGRQVDEGLLIEKARPDAYAFGPDTRVYYLVARGLAVVENIRFPPPDERWSWYVHLARITFDAGRDCWIKQDLFADVILDRAGREALVIDLDDLATALDLGLVTPAETSAILRQTDAVVRAIHAGAFPFPEIERARAACKVLGW